MNGLHILLLPMLQSFKGERTASGCYHILRGKKSGQAIQDSALFGYRSWFGLFQRLDWNQFQAEIQFLLSKNYIEKADGYEASSSNSIEAPAPQTPKDFYLLTVEGMRAYEGLDQSYRLQERGFLIEPMGLSQAQMALFWDRLQLLAQVLSYSLQQIGRFVPIVESHETQKWFKSFWRAVRDKKEFAIHVSHELRQILGQMEDSFLADLLVSRLTGYQQSAQTWFQLERSCRMPEALLRLYHSQAVGYLYHELKKRPATSLASLCELEDQSVKLTYSAQKTYELLKHGRTLEDIATLRQLKRSTVEDHLIEVAIHDPSYDFSRFLPASLQQQILNVSERLQTKKLAQIRKELGEQASYLQIRLALLRGQEKEGQGAG